MEWRKIICLAKSRKMGGYCIAGKEINSGKWIRPISIRSTEEINSRECMYDTGKEVEVLDIVNIPIEKYKPNEFQPENFLINCSYQWKYESKFEINGLSTICDTPQDLWLIKNCYNCSSYYGKNDRIPQEYRKQISQSLYFITPKYLKILVRIEGEEFDKPRKRVRADFIYNNCQYIIPVTDITIEKYFFPKDIGRYTIENPKNRIYMCLSIAPFEDGYCYKFVASIIPYEGSCIKRVNKNRLI